MGWTHHVDGNMSDSATDAFEFESVWESYGGEEEFELQHSLLLWQLVGEEEGEERRATWGWKDES